MALVIGALVLLAGCAPDIEPAATPSTTVTETPETLETPEAPDPTPTVQAPVVNGPNSITSPSPGAAVPGPAVLVTGEGTAFEATLSYRVVVPGTEAVVDEGWTMAGANGEIGPYTIELTLDPGEYTVQVWEPDVSDGESPDGPQRNLVEVTFTVT
jgi:hypothetical protein